jgi:hypothetical protein
MNIAFNVQPGDNEKGRSRYSYRIRTMRSLKARVTVTVFPATWAAQEVTVGTMFHRTNNIRENEIIIARSDGVFLQVRTSGASTYSTVIRYFCLDRENLKQRDRKIQMKDMNRNRRWRQAS